IMDIETYVKTYWGDDGRPVGRRPKVPRAAERDILDHGPPEVAELIRQWDATEVDDLTRELFNQRKRVADGERALQSKATKKAAEDVRIGTNKVKAARRRLDAIAGKASEQDHRIYPGVYCPVLVIEDGKRQVKLMRYQCRPAGKPSVYDRKYPGTYNARRDNLEGFWKGQFGYSHGIMVADRFYENVEGPDGANQVLEFEPRTGEPMLVACLWSHWTDPTGKEPDLLSFAAITDEPEPEVAATGHDRTIINIKPEHLDAWLQPDPGDLAALYAIFDDKRHPFYEHRLAA
ncbi:SOS response-associated peptidase family protein, partial [Marilutibacter aestuarii]